MVEGARAAEQIFEPVEDSRKAELHQKLERLDEARGRILADAGARVLTKQEKKAIIKWMKRRGSEEEWPLDDNITQENYQSRLAPYGVLDLVNPNFITGKNDIYNLVNRQYVTLLQELQQLERQPTRFRLVSGGVQPVPATPAAPETPSPRAVTDEGGEFGSSEPEPEVEEEPPKEPEPEIINPAHEAMGWKTWEMIFAMLHSMQKHPEQFEELKNLSPTELNAKLRDDGPRLVKEYIRLATRGRMEWHAGEEEKLWEAHETKLANVDVKVSLLVLQKAGFKVDLTPTGNLEMTPPGGEGVAKPFVLQFDTMATAKRAHLVKEQEAARQAQQPIQRMHIETPVSPDTDLEEGEYRVTVDHHTDDPDERRTSSAQLLYDYFTASGIMERDETLERLLAFTNAHDNGEFPANRAFYERSAQTIWGIGSEDAVSAELLYELFKKGRGPEDTLTEGDLALPLTAKRKERRDGVLQDVAITTVGDLVAWKLRRNAEQAEEFDRWKDRGYIIDTDYGPMYVCLEIPGRSMPKQTVARAYGGVPNILIWSPEKHSFFIALGSGKQFKPGTRFPQGEIIRGHLAIYKKQERTPEDLTASLREVLTVLSRSRRRQLEKDLRALVAENITSPFATFQTLYYIYTTNPTKRDEVVAELARRNDDKQRLERQLELLAKEASRKQDKLGYRKMLEAVRQYLRTHHR